MDSVITELDPVKKTHATLYNVLIALTVGLCFIAMPEAAAGAVGASVLASNIGAHLVIALQEAPMVARAIWPQGTVDSQLLQIGEITSELGNVNNKIGNMLNAGLEKLMSDIPTFVSFVEDGHFSGGVDISLPKSAEGLDMALKTFVVSTAMTKNDWKAMPFLNMDLQDFAATTNCTITTEGSGICVNPEAESVVSYFYSNISGNGYMLSGGDSSNEATKTPTELLNHIVENDWSTLSALFDGAFNCTAAGNAASDQPFHIRFDGSLDLSCVSQLRICSSSMAYQGACMVPFINDTCPIPTC